MYCLVNGGAFESIRLSQSENIPRAVAFEECNPQLVEIRFFFHSSFFN